MSLQLSRTFAHFHHCSYRRVIAPEVALVKVRQLFLYA